VHRLCVRKGRNGLGLGSYVIDWCANKVSSLIRRFLRLESDVRNAKLCAFCESLFFVRVGITPIPEDGDYIASLYGKSAR